MKISDVSIKRPVFATMMIVTLLVLGAFSYYKLSVDMFPDVEFPYVVVSTILPGAGPEQIESDVTKPIEDAVNAIAGVDHVESRSMESFSMVIIQFKLEVDGKTASQEVREKISAIRAQLPNEIEDPVIQRYDPASQPIMTLVVAGQKSEKELTTYTKDVIKKRLENVSGVGNIALVGGAEREIKIDVDPDRLKAYTLSMQDVINGVAAANVEIPGGNLNQGKRQLLLRTVGKFTDVEDFKNIIIKNDKGNIIRLSEIASIEDGVIEKKSLTRYNNKTAVGLNVLKQSGANTVEVAAAVQKELAKMKVDLPKEITVDMATDNSIFIRDSVKDVIFDIFYGGLLAVIVIYLFLANLRSTIISAIALPVSIIATFTVMYALNFTLNMMTLLALSLAVGILIDDAIVVIENIYRHLDEGETPFEAAKSATNEIGLAVLATTFTIVAVFVPVAFMSGIVGRFFYQFGITVSVAVLVSLFVAFTLTPMLSSRWLTKEIELSNSGNIIKRGLYFFNHFFTWLNGKYKSTLAFALRHRLLAMVTSIIIFVGSLFLMRFLGSEFFPKLDQNEFNVTITAAPGSSIQQTDEICKIIEQKLYKRPEVTNLLTTIGANNNPVTKATILVKTIKKQLRDKSIYQIMDELREEFKTIPGAEISFQTAGGPGGPMKPINLSIRGNDIVKIKEISDKVEKILRSTSGVVDLSTSLEASKPEVRVKIKRDKASDLGINTYIAASTLRAMVDGYVATKYQEGGEQFDVRVRLKEDNRRTIDDIKNLTLMSYKQGQKGEKYLIPLGDVAEITEGSGPTQINRYERQREIRIEGNLSGITLGEVLAKVKEETAKMDLPPGYTIKVVGQAQMQEESFMNIFISLILAIIFVYIVLAMQFESFVYPFSIMLSLPMSIIGAVLALLLVGNALSIISLIGIIMLMGLVTKNAILLIDYTNVQRERGLDRTAALLKAGPTRLRPILMTTFAMIFGMLPVAMGLGEGSELRAPLGQAVIGGLITSTVLTLIVVPVVYTLLDDISLKKIKEKFRRKK